MKRYLVEYRMEYTMTKEVEAESENDAVRVAEGDPSDGDEHDVYCYDFTVIEEIEEEEEDDE